MRGLSQRAGRASDCLQGLTCVPEAEATGAGVLPRKWFSLPHQLCFQTRLVFSRMTLRAVSVAHSVDVDAPADL